MSSIPRIPRAGAHHANAVRMPSGAASRGMGLRIQEGVAVVWAGSGRSPSALGLASALAEQEEKGAWVGVVTLCARARRDAEWLPEVIEWLEAQGLGVVLRTRVRLPREFVLWLRGRDLSIELELASVNPDQQRALLGDDASAANELLLQAQHYAALGLEVGARVGPLLPGAHELSGFEAFVSALRAADIHALHLHVGHLSPQRLRALEACIDGGALLTLMRSFRLAPSALSELEFETRELPLQHAQALRARFGALVREAPGVALRDLARSRLGARRRVARPHAPLQASLFGEADAVG